MSKFKTMDKADKIHEVKLGQFRWPEAEDVVGIPFNSKGVKEAKALIAEAGNTRLKDPYVKIGKVKQHLVLRIKHDKKHHYGEGDIILIRDFAGVDDVSLSKKDKNAGALSLSRERDPISVKFWRETLDGQQDQIGLEALIVRYTKLRELAIKSPMNRVFDETLSTLDRIDRSIKQGSSKWPYENDRRILAKMLKGLAIHQSNIRARNDTYQAALGGTLKKLVAQLEELATGAAQGLDTAQAEVDRLKAAGKVKDAQKRAAQACASYQRACDSVSENQSDRHLDDFAKAQNVAPDDLRNLAGANLTRARDILNAKSSTFAAMREAAETLGAVSADPAKDKAWKKLQDMADKLKTAVDRTIDGADKATSLLETPLGYTNQGKNGEEWFQMISAGYDKLVPLIEKQSTDIRNAQKAVQPDNAAGQQFLQRLADQQTRFVAAEVLKMNKMVEKMRQTHADVPRFYKGLVDALAAYVENVAQKVKTAADLLEAAKAGDTSKDTLSAIRRNVVEIDQLGAESYKDVKLRSTSERLMDSGLLGVHIPRAKKLLDTYDALIPRAAQIEAEAEALRQSAA